jgi:hypothetical protein
MTSLKGYLKDKLPNSNTRTIYYLKAGYTATPVFSLAINSASCTKTFSRLIVAYPLRELTDCHMSSQRVNWLSCVLSDSRLTHMSYQRVDWLSHVLSESRLNVTCPLRESTVCHMPSQRFSDTSDVLFIDGSIAYVISRFYIQINSFYWLVLF